MPLNGSNPAPPILVTTNFDDDFRREDTVSSPISSASPRSLEPTSPVLPDSPTRIGSRRPSEAPTLALPAKSLHPASTLDADSSRSRASSVGEASMLSGSTARPDTSYTGIDLVNDEEALKPDPGTEKDFDIANNKFAFTPGQLNKFLNPKSLAAFRAVGGIRGLERGLQTDLEAGLSVDEGELSKHVSFSEAIAKKAEMSSAEDRGDSVGITAPGNFADRKRVFKDNSLPAKKAKSVWMLMWEQYQDKVLILLTIAAVISLALGLYETLGTGPDPDAPNTPKVDWVEGVAICIAILIVVFVGSVNDWQKERQFVKLNAKKEDRVVKAIRSGKSMQISVYDVLVGDVLHLEPGDMIPADGIFIAGHNLRCDESSATGESDQMKKTPGDEVYRQIEAHTADSKLDPFLISGSKVLEGVGTYLVTSTGVHSSHGRLMMALSQDAESTPLQVKLAGMADAIAYLGGGAALLLFIVLFIRFLINLPGNHDSAAEKGSTFLDLLIVCITLIVVAVPEGLPLAVTLALAFATTRMLKENNLVRVLRACETMGNATTICSDKTGTLTQNKMTVVAGTVGVSSKFLADSSDDADKSESMSTVVARYPEPLKDLLLKSIVLNSTAFEGEEDGIPTFIGSKTETAMLGFARDHLGLSSVAAERESSKAVQMVPFDSGRKCMGVVARLPNGRFRLYVKGASEILLAKATRRVSLGSSKQDLEEVDMDAVEVEKLEATIIHYAQRSLRTIGMLYKDYSQWPPIGAKQLEEDPTQADFDDIFNGMVFLGIVGIQDPLRPGVTDAVKQCQNAGICVRMVTGDNLVTAKAIAAECGIFTDGIVIEGPKFRTLSEKEMDDMLPRLQVLARSSPEDKRILVKRLKELKETVAVTGDGTNDAPALKMADVGFSMGIAGTEVAKEASSIILMDDNFSSIIKAIMWGRAVNDAVQKFLQFQLTVNITAVILTFVSAVASDDMKSVLTAVQLLWVNLIMDTFAALALATDAPTPEILNRKPTPKTASLVTLRMWKMIIGQAIYQLIVTFVLYFARAEIFPGYTETERRTVVFNTFVWMQIFNEFNNRRLDNKFNIFEGMFKNYFFLAINCIMIGGQILIIFVGSTAFSISRIDGILWAVCIIASAFSLPWAIVVRCVPDELVGRWWDRSVVFFQPALLGAKRVGHRLRFKSKKQNDSTDEEMATIESPKP